MIFKALKSTAARLQNGQGPRPRLVGFVYPFAFLALIAALWINGEWIAPSETVPLMWARISGRVDQLATTASLIAALALAVFGFPRWTKTRMTATVTLLVLLLVHMVAHGKLQEIGTDSHIELMRANSKEISDYLKGFVLVSGYNAFDAMALVVFAVVCALIARVCRKVTPSLVTGCCTGLFLAYASAANVALLPSMSAHAILFENFEVSLEMGNTINAAPIVDAAETPNVVVFIGESTSREAFDRHAPAVLAGSMGSTDELRHTIAYRDVISAHSHTFPSLFRALSVSADHEGDRFRLEQETRRASIVKLLAQSGYNVEWYSDQAEAGRQDWLDSLFGKSAALRFVSGDIPGLQPHARPFDDELIREFFRRTSVTKTRRVVSFIHGYAGHWPYCDNIPQAWAAKAKLPWSNGFPPEAIFGDLPLLNTRRHLQNIACQEAATAYTRNNFDRLVDHVDGSQQPVVLIYFPDHGEDPFDGTAHDSSRSSPRHLEIPFLVHFNDSAIQRFPELFNRAKENSSKPFSLDWFSQSLLDLAHLPLKATDRFSMFASSPASLPRFALMRQDIRGRRAVIAIDKDVADRPTSVALSGHDFFKKRVLLNELSSSDAQHVCGHRNDSLLKASEAGELFACLELDIVIDKKLNQLHVVHPPKADNGLQLAQVLALPSIQGRRVWLDVKNLTPDTMSSFAQNVLASFPPHRRQDVLIETDAADPSLRVALRGLVEGGFRLSYYVPDSVATCASPMASDTCQQSAKQIAHVIATMPFTDVSCDIHAFAFISQIQFDRAVMLNTWDLAARRKEDILKYLSPRLRNFIIPYRSRFDY